MGKVSIVLSVKEHVASVMVGSCVSADVAFFLLKKKREKRKKKIVSSTTQKVLLHSGKSSQLQALSGSIQLVIRDCEM